MYYIGQLMRIAHLSDVHLLSFEGTHAGDFLHFGANKRLLGGMNILLNRGKKYQTAVFDALVDDVNAEQVDHVACTGDITNLALQSEFRFARERFDRFALGPDGVTCIPGNHDKYVAHVAGLFEEVFAPYCAGDAAWRDGAATSWPIVRERGDLAIVGICSSLPTHLLGAYGTVGAAQLARVEEILADARLAGKFRLVMIHHPPAGKWARRPLRGLKDHEEFAAVLARTGAELVLHGHEHLDLKHTLRGPNGQEIPVHGIQSGSYDSHLEHRQGRYRIYTVERAAGAARPKVTAEELRVFRAGKFTSEGVRQAA